MVSIFWDGKMRPWILSRSLYVSALVFRWVCLSQVKVGDMAPFTSAPLKLLFFQFQILLSSCLSCSPLHCTRCHLILRGIFERHLCWPPYLKILCLCFLICPYSLFPCLLWVADIPSRPFLVPLSSIEHGLDDSRACLISYLRDCSSLKIHGVEWVRDPVSVHPGIYGPFLRWW